MYYLLLFVPILMWSFVGVLVKTASKMVNSGAITLSRFLFGIIFLGIYVYAKDKKLHLYFFNKWIWIGVIGKCCNYIFENIAISMGFSYGNVIVGPIQAIFLLFVSVYIFKEELNLRKLAAVIMCITGVLLVSWNGIPLSKLFNTNSLTTVLFVLSALGAAMHVISQKILIKTMDSGNMNFSVFFWSTIITATPLPFTFKSTGPFSVWALLALISLGVITGISFYIYANVLKKISFMIAVILSNCSSLFTLLWSRLFFHENITVFILTGAIIFISGLIVLHLPNRSLRKAA